MGKMRGVAATLVSVAVFVSLLISNLTLVFAENERLWMASVANLETDEGAIGSLLLAQGAYSALERAQTELVQSPPSCSSWNEYALSLASSSSYSGSLRAIRYDLTMNAALVESGPENDNLTLIHPFDGYSPGSLNLGVRVRLHEVSGGLPSYARSESHYIHLPVSLSRMLSLCLALLRDIHLTYSSGVWCNRLPSETRLNSLSQTYSRLAVSDGFSLAISHWFARVDGCWKMNYTVTLSEGSVEGVSGEFAWHLSDSGFA
jgi:hypothetical protein